METLYVVSYCCCFNTYLYGLKYVIIHTTLTWALFFCPCTLPVDTSNYGLHLADDTSVNEFWRTERPADYNFTCQIVISLLLTLDQPLQDHFISPRLATSSNTGLMTVDQLLLLPLVVRSCMFLMMHAQLYQLATWLARLGQARLAASCQLAAD